MNRFRLVAVMSICVVAVPSVQVRSAPALAASGDQVWVARYTGPPGGVGSDRPNAIAVSPDGTRLFVTGQSTGSGTDYDYATVAYDAVTGATLWSRRYRGPDDDYAYATSIGVSPDGSRVFVTGQVFVFNSLTEEDFVTFAYDAASGDTVWFSRYDSPYHSYDEAPSLAVSPDGTKLFLAGISAGPGTYSDFVTLAYDAATGSQLWATREKSDSFDYAKAIAVSPDGESVFVTGNMRGNFVTFGYDAGTGSHLWRAHYNPVGRGGEGRSVAVSPDGSRVFATGYLYGSGTGHQDDYATVAYDRATGAQLWSRQYNPGDLVDHAYSVAVSPDGSRVFVTGSSQGTGSGTDYATLAYDAATGDGLWLRRFTGFGGNRGDTAAALVVSPDGTQVFVTGTSGGVNYGACDYATIAYDAVSGDHLWLARYNHPPKGDCDGATDLVAGPDGMRVFVTGASVDPTTGDDYATVAYQA